MKRRLGSKFKNLTITDEHKKPTFCLFILIRNWCLTCRAEVEECQIELDEVVNGYKEGDAVRGRVDGVLQTKLKAIEAQIAENNNGRQKIQKAIVSCKEMAKLSPAMKLSPVIQKKIKQMKKEMEAEVEQAKILLDHIALSQTNV